jgi:hypothetical protein
MPASEDADPVRADGPPVVWDGMAGAPALLVFDPAGEGKHDELPATWRPLADQRQIIWCRLPTDGALTHAEEILSDPAALGPVVDVVASGPVAETAMWAVARHPDSVRSLLLVDPAAGGAAAGEPAAEADANWADRNAKERAELERAGVTVTTIAHSPGGDRDRIPPPLPLGHPDVVSALINALPDNES